VHEGRALVDHDGLRAQLERARRLGFLGPGPVAAHVTHGLAFVAALERVQGTVIDLGSGGGLPGLVLGVARPDLTLWLLEASAARCRFLAAAVAALELPAAGVLEGRAEVLGRGPLRGTADAVVARSFGPPAVTAECAAPFLRVGGILLVSEPPGPAGPRWPAAGLAPLGLVPGERSAGAPRIQVLHQRSACPADLPRRTGLPAKRPLF
jgi:16S rRNA (guanine527-N7)-methyltransferase